MQILSPISLLQTRVSVSSPLVVCVLDAFASTGGLLNVQAGQDISFALQVSLHPQVCMSACTDQTSPPSLSIYGLSGMLLCSFWHEHITTHGMYTTRTHTRKQVRYSFTGSLGQGGSDLGTWVEQQGGFTCVLTGVWCVCTRSHVRAFVISNVLLYLNQRRFVSNNVTSYPQGPAPSGRTLCTKVLEFSYSSTSQG